MSNDTEAASEPSSGQRPLVDSLFERLSEAIILGELKPGTKLSEPRLAELHGVSRAPLREAINRLEARKLVVRTHRQGARVVVPSLNAALELFAVREVLEGFAAGEAARNATEREIGELRSMLEEHRRLLTRPDAMVYWQATANADFHFTIARLARNGHLFDVLCGDQYTLLRFYRMQHRLVPGRALQALHEHERIVEAIAGRDGELATLLMRRHIAAARAGLVSSNPGADAPTEH